MRVRGWASVASAALALTLVAAGCGGGEGSSGDAGDRGGRAAKLDDAMLAFARCMRANGVDVPDPQPGERGFVIGPDGPPSEADARRFREADSRCRRHLANVRPPELSEEEREELQEAALKHARCMRRHGIDVPDPTFEGGGTSIPLGRLDPRDPDFQAAEKACSKYLGALRPRSGS